MPGRCFGVFGILHVNLRHPFLIIGVVLEVCLVLAFVKSDRSPRSSGAKVCSRRRGGSQQLLKPTRNNGTTYSDSYTLLATHSKVTKKSFAGSQIVGDSIIPC